LRHGYRRGIRDVSRAAGVSGMRRGRRHGDASARRRLSSPPRTGCRHRSNDDGIRRKIVASNISADIAAYRAARCGGVSRSYQLLAERASRLANGLFCLPRRIFSIALRLLRQNGRTLPSRRVTAMQTRVRPRARLFCELAQTGLASCTLPSPRIAWLVNSVLLSYRSVASSA